MSEHEYEYDNMNLRTNRYFMTIILHDIFHDPYYILKLFYADLQIADPGI